MTQNDLDRFAKKDQPTRDEICTRHDYFMRLALAEARQAFAESETPVGALLVSHEGETLARAHNRCIQLRDPTAHAELLCIQAVAAMLGGRLTGCTLYVTMEPCAMCAGAAINAKLTRLVFGAFDRRAGCCGSVLDFTDRCFLHSVEVWGGILERECSQLLSDFFKNCRVR